MIARSPVGMMAAAVVDYTSPDSRFAAVVAVLLRTDHTSAVRGIVVARIALGCLHPGPVAAHTDYTDLASPAAARNAHTALSSEKT